MNPNFSTASSTDITESNPVASMETSQDNTKSTFDLDQVLELISSRKYVPKVETPSPLDDMLDQAAEKFMRKSRSNIPEKILKINHGIESLEAQLASFKSKLNALNRKFSESWKMTKSALLVKKCMRKADRGGIYYEEMTGRGSGPSLRARWGVTDRVSRKSCKIHKKRFY